MSSIMEIMTCITMVTIAVHFVTGEGRVTAIILIVEAVITLLIVIDRIRRKAKK